MNRLKSAHSCRLCRHWFEGEWAAARTNEERAGVERQMDNGMCDRCQRRRQTAAKEFIAAADRIRLARRLGHAVSPVEARRVVGTHARCVELGLWGDRSWTRPNRFVSPPRYRQRHANGTTPPNAHRPAR